MAEENVVYEGRIVKGIAGFYYVNVEGYGVAECHAKGIFRKDKKKPLVGDRVSISLINKEKAQGIILKLHDRTSSLVRPEVANIDQAVLLFAYRSPNPNLDLLDKFMISMERQNIPVIICFNKKDLASQAECEEILNIYAECGSMVLDISASAGTGLNKLKQILKGKVTALAGPSGVGKSTLTNALCPAAGMEIGEISRKLERGRHTTRHSELLYMGQDTFLMDTPGFSALMLEHMETGELKNYYHEFYPYEEKCRYQPCSHIHEPGCEVLRGVQENKIHKRRYESYQQIYMELKQQKKY